MNPCFSLLYCNYTIIAKLCQLNFYQKDFPLAVSKPDSSCIINEQFRSFEISK